MINDWQKDLDDINAEMDCEDANGKSCDIGTSHQTLQNASTTSFGATTTGAKQDESTLSSADEDPFSSLSLESLVLSSKSGPSATAEETPTESSQIDNDPIIAKMLEQRGQMTDVSEQDEAERRKRMYIMLRWSNHYKKLQVEKANENWKAEDTSSGSVIPSVNHTLHADLVNGLENLLNVGNDNEFTSGQSTTSANRPTRTESPTEVEGPPIIDVDQVVVEASGFLATPAGVAGCQRRASSASSYADPMPNRGRIHGRRVSFSSRVTHIAVEGGLPFNPVAHLAAITSSCNLEQSLADSESSDVYEFSPTLDSKNAQRLDSGKHFINTSVSRLVEKTAADRPGRPLRVMTAQSTLPRTDTQQPIPTSTFTTPPVTTPTVTTPTITTPTFITTPPTSERHPYIDATRPDVVHFTIPTSTAGNSASISSDQPAKTNDDNKPVVTIIPDPTPNSKTPKTDFFSIFRSPLSILRSKPKRPSSHRSIPSTSPSGLVERRPSLSKRRRSQVLVSNVIASLGASPSPNNFTATLTPPSKQGFESSSSSNTSDDDDDDGEDEDVDFEAPRTFASTIPRKSICSSTSESTALGENHRQLIPLSGSTSVTDITSYLQSPQASKRGSEDTVAMLAVADSHAAAAGIRGGEKFQGRKGSLYETIDRTPMSQPHLITGKGGVKAAGMNANVGVQDRILPVPSSDVRKREKLRGTIGTSFKDLSAGFLAAFGKTFKKKRRGSRSNVLITL
ncbi:hypothetical protein HDU76_013384 [Blyttiomyces sp. JEL0837]|nr:hypothetical protein HDU76_013384 [Blyttiomyces sp. JEL0837]